MPSLCVNLPDPDLIIRTSGKIRLSGFLLWQSVHSEYYVTDVLWPAFRKVDFLRAIVPIRRPTAALAAEAARVDAVGDRRTAAFRSGL